MAYNNSIHNQCFNTGKPQLTASERSAEKRKVAIYNEIKENVKNLQTANPLKKNGFTYNQNTKQNPSCDISNGLVNYAGNYTLLADLKQGAQLLYPLNVSTPKYESWCGSKYSVDYAKHGIQSVVQVDGSYNIIDPSHVLFYDKCAFIFSNDNRPEPWSYIVDISFNKLAAYCAS